MWELSDSLEGSQYSRKLKPDISRRAKQGKSILNGEAIEREVDQRLGVVKALYGDRLDDQQLEEVRRAVEGFVVASRELRAVKLDNGIEPFSVVTPYREDG